MKSGKYILPGGGRVEIISPIDTMMRLVCAYYALTAFSFFGAMLMYMFQHQDDQLRCSIAWAALIFLFCLIIFASTRLQAEFMIRQSYQTGQPLLSQMREQSNHSLCSLVCIIGSIALSAFFTLCCARLAETCPNLFKIVSIALVVMAMLAVIATMIMLDIWIVFWVCRRGIADQIIYVGQPSDPDKQPIYCPARKAIFYFWRFRPYD